MHKKHGKLKKAERGFFHRNEWAILGTTCQEVEHFANAFMDYAKDFKIVYVDGIHRKVEERRNYTDWGETRISANFQKPNLDRESQILIADLVLINGNHFEATKQIVVLNPIKEKSLKKRLGQCTNVQAIVKFEVNQKNYSFLDEFLDQSQSKPEYFESDQPTQLYDFIIQMTKESRPEINALVLAGGESRRMGKDKSGLVYHDVPQETYLIELCRSLGLKTYLSKRKSDKVYKGVEVIKDRLLDVGPYGAICTAFMEEPNSAWLILACDMPFIEKNHLEELLRNRDVAYQATCYLNPSNELPEPLIAIYEPSAYPALLQNLSRGNSCPRKALIRMKTKDLTPLDGTFLTNVNTPDEFREVKTKLMNAR